MKKRQLWKSPVVLGFSGGPDAAALAHKLVSADIQVIPVYVDYRASQGGKTSKDIAAAKRICPLLNLPEPLIVRAPLGDEPKGRRNRHFLGVLADIAHREHFNTIALGTMRVNGERNVDRMTRNDLDPAVLGRRAEREGVSLVTWDSFGVREKSREFDGVTPRARLALFESTSCQLWFRLECGNCHSCIARHEAFMDAFGADWTAYRPQSRIAKMMR